MSLLEPSISCSIRLPPSTGFQVAEPDASALGSAAIEFDTYGRPSYVIKSYSIMGLRRFDALGVHSALMRMTAASGTNILEVSILQFYSASATYELKQPYCAGGNLMMLIDDRLRSNTPFTTDEMWAIFSQIVSGLLQLYSSTQESDVQCASNLLLHGALTPSNILFDASQRLVKLTDYGLYHVRALFMHQPTYAAFFAPELKDANSDYTEACDVWALGCILYSLCALQPPQFTPWELKRGINIYSRSCPSNIRTLISRCLDLNPARRPSVLEIASLPMVRALPGPSAIPDLRPLAAEDLSTDRSSDGNKRRPSIDIQSINVANKVDHQSVGIFHSILAAVAEAEADFDFDSDVEVHKPVTTQLAPASNQPLHDIYADTPRDEPVLERPPESHSPRPHRHRPTVNPRPSGSPRRQRASNRVRTRPRLVFSTAFDAAHAQSVYYRRRHE